MGVSVEIQSDFGYVVLVIVATWVLLNWLGLQVVKARRKYEVNVSKFVFFSLCIHPRQYQPVVVRTGARELL